jgi:CBS domain-containing protein
MIERHVGAIVVVDEVNAGLKPVGIITDRDVVCGQLNPPRDLFCMAVEDVMSADILNLQENCGIAEAVGSMTHRGVRRAPVVNQSGDLVGIISIDDLLPHLAHELAALAELIGTQAHREGSSHANS